MNKNQNEILQFLSKFKSCTENQLLFFTKCTIQDINYLLNSNLIVKDEKTKIFHLKMKKLDVRTAVALDVVIKAYKEIKEFRYSKNFPVIFNTITNENKTCDIAVVRNIEQVTIFEKLGDYSKADMIIIVLENAEYDRTLIKTNKEVLICKYPIEIIDKIN